jgi:thiamine pyrophosphate-dependent acetolactate synthase large subunit-like protein
MAAASSTVHDTLARKSTDAGVISGGHLVARALKNEGVETIFTLCGGHIIDIYDGGHGEEVREAGEIGPALRRDREAIARTGKCAVVNVWIDPGEYAPGTKAQTMYK